MADRPIFHDKAHHPPRRRVKVVGLNIQGKHVDCPLLWSKIVSREETIGIVLIQENPKPVTMMVTIETAGLAILPETEIEW